MIFRTPPDESSLKNKKAQDTKFWTSLHKAFKKKNVLSTFNK